MRIVTVLCLCALVLSGCYDTKPKVSEAGLPTGQVLLGAEDDEILVDVEIAQSDEHRQEGLMNRDSLPEDAGMMFMYFEPIQTGFWMKDVRFPLSIAFIDEEQTITEIIDMEVCEADQCPSYTPKEPFTSALEVNLGAFEEWGVEEGDTVTLLR